jgi:hypothetical protein
MFKVDTDRLDYGELLVPPVGYEASYAVGTTYSLDLETMTGIPMALSLAQTMDGQVKKSEIHILEAIRKASDKITVFCQSDKIAVPAEKRPVFSLLENSVYQVAPGKDNAFHPKAWIIKYSTSTKPEQILYRLIVLSRNLTFDRSWDIAACLDGKPGKSEYKRNQPVVDFLNYLSGFVSDPGRKKKVKALAKEILYANFQLNSKEFSDFAFLAFGLPGYKTNKIKLLEEKCEQMAVISPFLTPKTVDGLSELPSQAPMLLISRKAELYKLSKELIDRLECWHLKENVVDGEELLGEDGEETAKQDIHAKCYVITGNARSEVWLGSANCSYSAFNSNIEFMLWLSGSARTFNTETLRKDLFGEEEKANPFQLFRSDQIVEAIPDEEEKNEKAMEKYLREVCNTGVRAVIEPSRQQEGRFIVTVNFKALPAIPPRSEVLFSPLLCPNMAVPITARVIFDNLKTIDLSLFYTVQIKLGQSLKDAVIKIATENMPKERDGEIFRSIIKDQDGFLQYIAFLLGDDYLLAAMEHEYDSGSRWNKILAHGFTRPVVYEKMLKTVSSHPERLRDIQNLMDMLGRFDEELVPPEFKNIYEIFRRAAKKSRRVNHD